MTRDEAKEFSLKKMICRQSQIPFLRLIDKIYDDFKNKSCDGCIHHLSANGNFPLSCGECSRFYADNYEEMKK